MFLARRRPVYSHWTNYGCLTINIATMTGMTDAQQNAYLAVVKQAYPPTPGVAQWVRNTRYAISATTGTPDWNTNATRYWPNMYARPAASDIMTGRKIMFEPILWIRAAAGSFMLNPNAAPNYFGRNSSGALVVAEGSDTWRRDIRLNLDRLMWSDVGTTGGEPFVTNAKITNFSNLILIGPNEVDAWENARWYYLVDAEAGVSGAAYLAETRAETALSGAAGLNTLLLRIYDHQRHMFAWAREKRPDVGLLFPSVIDVASSGSREFTIYDILQFTHTGAGLTAQGVVNDVCDGHQIHPHMYQSVIPNPWTGGVPSATHISCYWYWKANEAVQTWRLANALPDNTRPLFSTETGQDYIGSGAVTTGRTDLFQLRRLKYGMLVLGQLYYGVSMINFYAVGRSAATGFNTIDPANDTTYWGDAAPNRDADFAFQSLDMRETTDLIPFVAKPWQDYWKDWQVWIQAPQQDPIDGGPSVCPFVEWNRVVMAGSTVTMNAGGRNIVARKKNVKRGVHTFSAEVRLTAAGSGAALRVSGHDKLNGLNLVSSSVLSGVQDWTPLSVSFTPRQHGNRRLPDPAYAVLMIDHNGVGTCEVRNPTISIGGAIPIEMYFDVQVMDVAWSPINPVAGNAVTFTVLVKNVGNQVTPSGVIHGCRFDVDGAMVSWTDNITTALQPNEERWQTANGGPGGSSTWVAVVGQHTVLATFDDVNRMPAERFKTNNTMSKTVTVAAQTGPTVPPQAVAAGLTNLFFNDDFTTLSLYNQTTNPGGVWRCNDFYQNAEHAGYVDLGGRRTFMINQTMSGTGSDTYSDLVAYNAIQPYLPITQLDSTTMRITARRARLSERSALRTVVNAIAVNTQGQSADTVTWLGAFLTTEKVHPYAPADITRPAYIECRMRFTPANINGIFSSFWLYDTSEVSGSPEIDIFESNDLTPNFWKTNIHHSQTGPSFNLQHNSAWNDGQFHTIGMLWTDTALQVYRDNVLSQSLTGADAAFYSMPMRLIITHTVDPHYAAEYGLTAPSNVEQIYMDIDRISVWTAGAAPPPVEELETGNPSEDLYDALIMQYATQHGHPSPRILKAQMKWESNQIFDVYCTSTDTPCGIFPGWTSAESRSFGLMQVTPACGESGNGRMLLANGHPNMTTDPGNSLWSGSVYNPTLNIDVGIGAVAAAYDYFKGLFPTCPDTSLVLMAAAGYVGDWADVTGCGTWTSQLQIDYVNNVVRIYEEWYGQYVQSTGYDLVVDSISWSPSSPTVGQAVTFSAVIRNTGNAPTPGGIIHGIGFRIDGGPTVTWSASNTSSLAGGATRNQTADGGTSGATWPAVAGTHTVTATVDDVNRMPNETNNTNNSRTAQIVVSEVTGPIIRVGLGQSWQSAIDAATPGTTILIAPGVYTGTGSGRAVRIAKSGTSSQRYTIKGDGGRAILDIAGVTGTGGRLGIDMNGANYWTIQNISIRNGKQPTSGGGTASGIQMWNCSNNILDNCESYGHEGPGILIGNQSGNNLIQYCEFYNNFDPIATGSGGYGGQADGIDFYAIADGYTGNRLMYCSVHDNSDDGVDLWESEEVIHIEGCFAYRNGYVPGTTTSAGDGNGIKLGQNFTYPPHEVISCRSWNNKFNGFDSNNGGGNMIISNNAAWGNGGGQFTFYAPATPIMTNNITYDPGTPPAILPGIRPIT